MTKKSDESAAYYDTHDVAAEFGDDGWEKRAPVSREAMMITTSLRLPKPIMDEVRKVADERGVKPTALMRRWIEAALVDQETVVPVSVLLAAATEYQHRAAC